MAKQPQASTVPPSLLCVLACPLQSTVLCGHLPYTARVDIPQREASMVWTPKGGWACTGFLPVHRAARRGCKNGSFRIQPWPSH